MNNKPYSQNKYQDELSEKEKLEQNVKDLLDDFFEV